MQCGAMRGADHALPVPAPLTAFFRRKGGLSYRRAAFFIAISLRAAGAHTRAGGYPAFWFSTKPLEGPVDAGVPAIFAR